MKPRIAKRSGTWICEVNGAIWAYVADAHFSIGEAIDWFKRNAFLVYAMKERMRNARQA